MQVFGYGRASTDKQTLTLEAQKSVLDTAYCNRRWPQHTTYEWCADAAVSSKSKFLERPAGALIARKVQRGDVLMVASYDRLWRSLRDFLETMDWIQDVGIELIILDFGSQEVDSRTPMGKAMLSIMAVIKQLEREEIGRRTKAALDVVHGNQHIGERRKVGFMNGLIRRLDWPDSRPEWIAVPHPAERVLAKWLSDLHDDAAVVMDTALRLVVHHALLHPVTGANSVRDHYITQLIDGHRNNWPLWGKPLAMPAYPFQYLDWRHAGPNVESGRLRLAPATLGLPSWTSDTSLAALVLQLERETFPGVPDRPLVALAAGAPRRLRRTS